MAEQHRSVGTCLHNNKEGLMTRILSVLMVVVCVLTVAGCSPVR